MATKTYAETPYAATTLHDGDVIIVQQGTDAAPTGYTQMKKTTLEKVKAYAVGTIEDDVDTIGAENAVLKRTVKEQSYRIENLEAMAKGELYTEHTETTSGGVLALPSSSPLAPWAEVEKVEGKTEAYMSVDLGSLTWGAYGNRMYTEIPNVVSDTPSISSNRLVKASWGDTGEVANTMVMSGTTLYANNNGITDASAFKTAMNGVTLRYDGTSNSLHSSTLSKVVSKDSDGDTMQSVTLPSLTLKGVGSACDTYLPSTGKVQRKVKTLSSSAWAYDSGWGAWRLRNLDISPTNSGSEAPSLISSYYTVTPYSSGFSDKCLTAFNSLGSSLLIKDSDYTSDQAEAFNTHMAEVTILYPTTTPTEETSTTIDPYIAVEAGGSVSVVSTNAQAEASVHYLTDLT